MKLKETKRTERKIDHPEVVSRDEWIVARKDFLAREKEFTRERDALSAARRKLPMVKVEQDYVFHGPDGKEKLSELFDGRSQLIVYHFMLGPAWEEGCKSCSYLADHFDGPAMHLPHRDVSLVVVSRAPWPEIEAYKKRMGWHFKWVSSHGNQFNFDYHVSFTKEEEEKGKVIYNYETTDFMCDELPGLSVFYKNEEGDILHSYSSYARGLDMLVGTYQFLDLVSKGRDENPDSTMDWVRGMMNTFQRVLTVPNNTMTTRSPENFTAEIRRLIKAPRDRVYAAWTDPAQLREWFGPKGIQTEALIAETRVGGRFRWELINPEGEKVAVHGEYRELQPDRKIVFTWQWEDDEDWENNVSVVTVELSDADGGTELCLTHEKLPNDKSRDGHTGGWNSALDKLESFFGK